MLERQRDLELRVVCRIIYSVILTVVTRYSLLPSSLYSFSSFSLPLLFSSSFFLNALLFQQIGIQLASFAGTFSNCSDCEYTAHTYIGNSYLLEHYDCFALAKKTTANHKHLISEKEALVVAVLQACVHTLQYFWARTIRALVLRYLRLRECGRKWIEWGWEQRIPGHNSQYDRVYDPTDHSEL